MEKDFIEFFEVILPIFNKQGILSVLLAVYLYKENQSMKLKKEISLEFARVLSELKNELGSRGCRNFDNKKD